MPVGIVICVLAVVLGGWLGSMAGDKLSDRLKQEMTVIFGACGLAMGITAVIQMKNMPAVIFAVIAGGLIGNAVNVDKHIRKGTAALLEKMNLGGDMQLMVTAMVLFCASTTGIYGSLISGMTGDHSILISKAVLDFFTAMIFACQLKKAVMLIGIPQLAIMLALFFSGRVILPLTNETMIADFKACGGIVLLCTGFTIMKIKVIPVANLLLSMVLVMPGTALWIYVIAPMI